ncbi:hypothetical protein EX895_001890 [Sporisorium graminicola]|uniref:FAD-binding FR-type domain-containing protein n=1 Tax=Sporisorium graminicola TaxID=280036 RepID=A0A4V6EU59_9BASI|nr:hypothetical protein EX895_001890 [Sporisorium graminicola]TKY89359.1 hypothetical protein EX895_001890 [Sporisorium graminicola]
MIPNPWTMGAESLEYINGLPPDQQQPALLSLDSYYYNSMKVPCITSFVVYGLFVILILATAFNNLLAWSCPSAHIRTKQRLRVLRAYVWEHPLVQRKHASVVSLPGLRWLTLQLPLRGEGIIVLALCLINFLPLVAFYQLLEPIPGSDTISSKSDQILRGLADRSGLLGTAQLPLLILMASKRTPLAIVSGLGPNSLMLYHRWISRWFWIHIFIHSVAYTVIYKQQPDGISGMLKETYIRWGVVGTAMGSGLVFLSLRALRQRHYEVFVMFHIVMAFFAILGTYFHIALIEYGPYGAFKVMTELAAIMWAFDRVVRLAVRFYLSFSLASRSDRSASTKKGLTVIECAQGQIRAFGINSNYVRLRISVPVNKLRFVDQPRQQSLFGGVGAGDDIRVTIPRLQWVGEHPFTVFAVGLNKEDPSQGYIELLIKAAGGLTRKLANQMITSTATDGQDKDVELAGSPAEPKSLAMLIEGPFGRVPEIHESTTDLVLVAGGIAITFCWPLFVAAFKSSLKASNASKLATCKLVWIVRQESTLTLLEEAFDELVKHVQVEQGNKHCQFALDIYVTSTASSPLVGSAAASIKDKGALESPQCQQGSISRTGSELPDDVAELPTLAHTEAATRGEKGQVCLFSDGVEGDLIKTHRFSGGRPQILSATLFGHLDQEALARQPGQNLTVAFCGPSSLCDDVRHETVSLLKKGIQVELVEECFTW